MSKLSDTFVFFGKLVSKKTSGLFGVWILSTLLLLVPSVIFWFFHGKIASMQLTLSEIFKAGIENIKTGADFFHSIPPEMQPTLYVILALIILTFVVITGFVQSGFVGFLKNDSSSPGEQIKAFFKSGIKSLPQMIVANLIIALVILFAVVVGFLIGAIVFMIAGLLLLLVVIAVAIYAYVRFAYTPYIVVLEKKSGPASIFDSMSKTGKHTGTIAFIVLPLTLASQYITGLVTNMPGLTELVMSLFFIIQLALLMPLYLDSIDNKKNKMVVQR
ncbi:MAG TPA: hypothetical protein PKV16_07635 [Caldisericia bacterium]|nr:hypothetical protein [Caldisericia bacterium]HPF49704.1 hypothetical protein [Caldisericia bacterium]HPI84523.1 hypothetical protein [Caldisericia bacterium]HPQ93638.1 hypothetical protein [Caldisericia bacterium]HRV74798.1 hypothetical protein [Caldisericia bacterium]